MTDIPCESCNRQRHAHLRAFGPRREDMARKAAALAVYFSTTSRLNEPGIMGSRPGRSGGDGPNFAATTNTR